MVGAKTGEVPVVHWGGAAAGSWDGSVSVAWSALQGPEDDREAQAATSDCRSEELSHLQASSHVSQDRAGGSTPAGKRSELQDRSRAT